MVFTRNDYFQMHPQEVEISEKRFYLLQGKERARNWAIEQGYEQGFPTYIYNFDQRPQWHHLAAELMNAPSRPRTFTNGSNLRTAVSGRRTVTGNAARRTFSMGNPFLDAEIDSYLGVKYRPPTPTPTPVRRNGTRSLSNRKQPSNQRSIGTKRRKRRHKSA
jgi:hypothetical protein